MTSSQTHYVTIKPVFATVRDLIWAEVFKPGTAMHLNGGIVLRRIELYSDGIAGIIQHAYYPPVECIVKDSAITPLIDVPVFSGCIEDPRCFNTGIRRKPGAPPCRCLGCWAIWWQRRAAEKHLIYPKKGKQRWQSVASSAGAADGTLSGGEQ